MFDDHPAERTAQEKHLDREAARVARRKRIAGLPDDMVERVKFDGIRGWEAITDLYVRVLSGDRLDAYKCAQWRFDDALGRRVFVPEGDDLRLVLAAACTEDLDPYFDAEKDVAMVGRKNQLALEAIYDAAARINKLDKYREKKD